MSALSGAFVAKTAQAAEARRAESEQFDLTRLTLEVPGLDPAHDGLTVAQLSDVHVGRNTPDGRIISAVRAVNAAKPDLVFLTGDYVTTRRDPFDRIPLVLGGLEAPTFAVLGNHDHWSGPRVVQGRLEASGYHVLRNQHTVVHVRGAAVSILGVDDGHTGNDDVEKTFQGAPTRGTRLVLAHTPPTADKLPPFSNLLCMSGHTHGGQLFIPKVTEGFFRRVGQPYVRGLHQVRGNQLYVNRGLGYGRGSPLVRVGSEPEVTVLTLRAVARLT